MYMYRSVRTGGVKCTLGHMFLKGCARGGCVFVELEQALGQCAVVESVGTQQVGYDCFVPGIGHKVLYGFAAVFETGVIKFLIESEFLYVVKEGLLKRGGGGVITCVQETEKIFEHAACGA